MLNERIVKLPHVVNVGDVHVLFSNRNKNILAELGFIYFGSRTQMFKEFFIVNS